MNETLRVAYEWFGTCDAGRRTRSPTPTSGCSSPQPDPIVRRRRAISRRRTVGRRGDRHGVRDPRAAATAPRRRGRASSTSPSSGLKIGCRRMIPGRRGRRRGGVRGHQEQGGDARVDRRRRGGGGVADGGRQRRVRPDAATSRSAPRARWLARPGRRCADRAEASATPASPSTKVAPARDEPARSPPGEARRMAVGSGGRVQLAVDVRRERRASRRCWCGRGAGRDRRVARSGSRP